MTDHQLTPSLYQRQQQGYSRANNIILAQITAKVKQQPSFNLSQTLTQHAANYPKLRETLGKVTSTHTSVVSSSLQDGSVSASTSDAESSIQTDAQLLHPFSDQITASLCPGYSSSSNVDSAYIDEQLISALNKEISQGQVLWAVTNSRVVALGSSYAVKIGSGIDIDHIQTLQLIKRSCSGIPAPDVHGVLKSGRIIYLFMSLTKGVSLDRIWNQFSHPQKLSIQSQLNDIFASIRAIPHHEIYPGLELGGGSPPRCKDTRRITRVASSDITSEADFHDFLCTSYRPSSTQTAWSRMIRSMLTDKHTIVITHGDLHPRNIMVSWSMPQALHESKYLNIQPSYNVLVTSIVDWECCGCYPEYWEYIKALHTIGLRSSYQDWIEYLPLVAIGSWPSEFAADILLNRWLG